jgi:hypothetical protein
MKIKKLIVRDHSMIALMEDDSILLKCIHVCETSEDPHRWVKQNDIKDVVE